MRSDDPITLLSLENPVSEDEVPSSADADTQLLLGRILRDDGPDPLPPTRRRLAPRLAMAGALAAAAALGLFAALPGDGVLPGDEPESASAVERAAATIGTANGDILHVVTLATVTGPDGNVLHRERTEAWQMTSPSFDMRQVMYSDGEATRELAVVDGRPEVYDPRTNTISSLPPELDLPAGAAGPPLPGSRRPIPGDGPTDQSPERLRAQILDLLRSGEAHETGRVTVDGREAIRIVAPAMDMTLLVDAQTYEPIEWSVPVTGIGTSPDHGILTTRFETYERLPSSEANLALLDLRAQHPQATVDHRITIDRDPPGKAPVPGDTR